MSDHPSGNASSNKNQNTTNIRDKESYALTAQELMELANIKELQGSLKTILNYFDGKEVAILSAARTRIDAGRSGR